LHRCSSSSNLTSRERSLSLARKYTSDWFKHLNGISLILPLKRIFAMPKPRTKKQKTVTSVPNTTPAQGAEDYKVADITLADFGRKEVNTQTVRNRYTLVVEAYYGR
jgi:hypothetical protein